MEMQDLPDMDGFTLEDKTRMMARWIDSAKQSMQEFNEAARTLALAKQQIEEQQRTLAQIAKTLEGKATMLQWPIWHDLLTGNVLEDLRRLTRPGDAPAETLQRLVREEKARRQKRR